MKKHELLVPAGNMECLYQAVYYGADAVYIAGQSFGARKFATNFTNEELISAIKFCHLYGVKVFVTMNTLIKDNEIDDYLEQVRFLHKNNVDAIIVQDFGMICLLREMFPNLEIHASTQANNSSKDICKLFYEIGVKRVVFSRELSIDEIDSIDVPIEKEAFIHGALCVSYSGCCLMSSMLGGRSGNRGECTGSCRLPYELTDNDKVIKKGYLLSMKELNTSASFNRLMDSSVYSFKIEGRMKGPLYVGFITNLYRRLIDGEKINLEIENEKLMTIFNREFTKGHIFNINDSFNINSKSPNHVGLKIGKVSVSGTKIKIVLDKGRVLNQNDAIRFVNANEGMIVNYLYDKNMKLCSRATDICYVDNKVGLKDNDFLAATQDSLLEKEYLRNTPLRKVPITFNIKAHTSQSLEISVSDGINNFCVYGDVVCSAIKSPTSRDDIYKHLDKLGNTPFILDDVVFDISDNIFIQVKALNDLRRELIEKLTFARENNVVNEYLEVRPSFSKFDDTVVNNKTSLVFNEEQLKACIDLSFNRIYVSNKDLYNKYSDNSKVYYALQRCALEYNDIPLKCLASDFFYFNSNYVIGSYQLNVFNIYTAYYLRKYGLRVISLSVELSNLEIKNLVSRFKDKFGNVEFELLKYGRIENMIIKGNILEIDTLIGKYNLIDVKSRKFPVFYDGNLMHILNHEDRDFDDSELENISLRYDFYDENYDEIIKVVNNM